MSASLKSALLFLLAALAEPALATDEEPAAVSVSYGYRVIAQLCAIHKGERFFAVFN